MKSLPAVLAVVAVAAVPRPVRGQAWAPPAGTGSVTLAAQAIDNTGHVLSDGSTVPAGMSRDGALYAEVSYAVTDRLAIAAGLPYVFAKYVGPPPPPGASEPPMVREVDACYCWRNDLQDLGVTVRFNVLNGATALAASASAGLPTHAYAYAGEAVVGRRLREARVAVDLGRRLDVVSPRLTLSARYSYAFVEQVLDVRTNRSNAALELGFSLTRALAAQALLYRQVTHGGLRAGVAPPPPGGVPWGEIATPALFAQHDRLMRDDYWRAGAAVSWDAGSVQLFASYVEYLGGTDTHAGRAFTVGVEVPFGR